MPAKFGQLLLWGNLISPEQLDRALDYQKKHGGRLGEILNRLGYLSNDDLTRSVALRYGVPTVNLNHINVDPEVLAELPPSGARARRLIPVSREGSTLTCAMEDPTRIADIQEVEFLTGYRVQPVLVTRSMMDDALARLYPPSGAPEPPPRRPAPDPFPVRDIIGRVERLPAAKRALLVQFLDNIENKP